MYSIVLMVALGSGGDATRQQAPTGGHGFVHGHYAHRHNRCSCSYACSGVICCTGHLICNVTGLCSGYRHERCCGAVYGCYSYPVCCPETPVGHAAGYGTLPGTQVASEVQAKRNAAKEEPASASAILIVNLPAEAKLIIDENATQSTSGTRRFTTPPLEPQKDFYYTLKGQLVRDGQALTASRRVRVRAGEQTEVTLEFPAATLSAKLTP
jgi:uncharacterized protein (TIGR03000 family)